MKNSIDAHFAFKEEIKATECEEEIEEYDEELDDLEDFEQLEMGMDMF